MTVFKKPKKKHQKIIYQNIAKAMNYIEDVMIIILSIIMWVDSDYNWWEKIELVYIYILFLHLYMKVKFANVHLYLWNNNIILKTITKYNIQ